MDINDVIEIDITDISAEGRGIGRSDEGAVVFVEGALPGDRVRARITGVKKNFSQGEAVLLARKSPYRREKFCQWQGMCGGCGMGELDYDFQLKLKERQIKDKLERIAGVSGGLLTGIVGDEAAIRNKAVMAVGEDEDGNPTVGFRERGGHQVIDCADCCIQATSAMAVAEALRQYMRETGVKAYNPYSGKGLIKNLIVKTAFGTGEVMAIIVANREKLPQYEMLVNLMDEYVNQTKYSLESVILNVNPDKNPDKNNKENNKNPDPSAVRAHGKRKVAAKREILGEKCVVVAGKGTIEDHMMGLKFQISPLSFYQVNPVQAEKLYEKALEYAMPDNCNEPLVADLYCGVGTIGLIAASKGAKQVIGIESARAAILDANRNAVINGIVNARFITGKAEEAAEIFMPGGADAFMQDGADAFIPDAVILDPPRRGCDAKLLRMIGKVAPERIVYISCDPGTLCRDLKTLREEGYEIMKATAFDMFPNTMETECCVLLTKGKI